MKTIVHLIRRNIKLYFKDKGIFFTSLITPLILLVLYVTFLANIYRDSFIDAMPEGVLISGELLNSMVISQLIASILAVCCVTCSFCANLLMINDKANKSILDFTVSPIKRSSLAIGYYISSALSTLIITFTTLLVCLIYLKIQNGFYLSFVDVLLTVSDVFLLTLFGTSLACCVNFFLTTSGQGSAVGTIVSSGYGFLCGAYMSISNFPKSLQKVLSFLPSTYGTSLIRNHMTRGVLNEMKSCGLTSEIIIGIRDNIDCNLYFGGKAVPVPVMAMVIISSIILFTGLFVLFNVFANRKNYSHLTAVHYKEE